MYSSDFLNMLEAGHRPSRDPVYMPVEAFAGLFPIGKLSMIGGKAGIGKSWFVRYCMMQASVGLDVFGGEVREGPMKSACFCGEDDFNELQKRDYSLRDSFFDEKCTIYFTMEGLVMVGTNPVLVSPQDPESVDKFFDMLKQMIAWYKGTKADEPPMKCLFFDSLGSFNEGDENSNKDMRALCFRLMQFAQSEHVAVVLVHHKRKKSKDCKDEDDTDEFSGSSAMMRFIKTAYSLKRVDNSRAKVGGGVAAVAVDNAFAWGLQVTQSKNSSLVVPKFKLNVTTFDGEDVIALKDDKDNYTVMEAVIDNVDPVINLKQERSELQEKLAQGIMDFMAKGEALSSEIKDYLKRTLKITFSDGTLRQVLRDMIDNDEIARGEKRGNDYVYRTTTTTTAASGGADNAVAAVDDIPFNPPC